MEVIYEKIYDKDNKISDEFACDFYSPYHRVSVEINGPHHKIRVNKKFILLLLYLCLLIIL